jgi:low temperature requirement protein LtrA
VVDLVAYAWLGNQARADEGVLRVGMAVAMAAIFVVALTIPEAWHDAPGGLDGPLVLVGAYLVVRCVHLTLYGAAAAGDQGLRHQLAVSWGPLLASAALLVPGALVGGWTQTLLFAGALLVDWGGIYLTSRQGSWRVHSAGHWTERHGNFVILAIGESVVAIGVGAAQQPISAPLLLAAVLGVASRACWPTQRSPSRWAGSTGRRCSAGWRCIWPGSCCSSSACTAP